jgi:hypothetical protein
MMFLASAVLSGLCFFLLGLWMGGRGIRQAFLEGRDNAIDAAACKALDFGREDIRAAINALVDGQRLHERLEYKDRMKEVRL